MTPVPTREVPTVDVVKKYDTVVSSGQSALRALLTMNGGAIVVFLTFLGHAWDKGAVQHQSLSLFVTALSFFIAGVFFALLSYGSIFVTNCLSSEDWPKSANGAFGVTIACGLASIVCFFGGSWRAIDAFRSVTALLSTS